MVARNSTSKSRWLMLQVTLLMILCEVTRADLPQVQSPVESPPLDPQPVLPLLAPSPLMPNVNVGVPKFSGKCPLNFSNAESMLTTTSIDCWDSLAPYLANAVCCPQLDAAIKILIGQSSFSSGTLAVSEAHAKDCLSDIAHILEAQSSNKHVIDICSISPSNLTQASCPIVDVMEIENIVNIRKVIESCEKIDPVNECRHKVCENAIMDAALMIASKNYSTMDMEEGSLSGVGVDMIDDCKKIVIRWLASKLSPSNANKVLRGISSCKINKVCPLVIPDTKNVSKECGNTISNQTDCCNAMENYMTQLQDQTFITNLQAFNCAYTLAVNLQKANVSIDVYDICRIKLKDFSLQVGSQDSGCLFPSLPLDVTYDERSGIGFKCDLNDNVAAPWPSSSPSPSSNMSTFPALPKAASDHRRMQSNLFVSALLLLNLFI